MNNYIIKIDDLSKKYLKSNQETQAITDLNLNIQLGEFIGIKGMSGSGKTTLLNLIAGFDVPSKGNVIVDGLDLSKLSDKEVSEFRNKKIGMIFQHFNLIREFTVLQNVTVPSIIAKKNYLDAIEIAKKLLSQQGLDHRLYHYPNELSGGEQQRVAVARALMNNPGIILADEPTANLDKESASKIAEILSSLHEDGRTLVVISPDDNILKAATRIITMSFGEIKDVTNSISFIGSV